MKNSLLYGNLWEWGNLGRGPDEGEPTGNGGGVWLDLINQNRSRE